MKVKGFVREVTLQGENSSYILDDGAKSYRVHASGIQAIKDYLFVREGQQMQVKGRREDDILYAEKSLIILRQQ